MNRPQGKRSSVRALKIALICTPLVLIVLGGFGCSAAFTRYDYDHMFDRKGWNRPEEVIAALNVQPGDSVVDLGAGDGYFSYYLADAVGNSGHVYAVDTNEKAMKRLQAEAEERGYDNITAIVAEKHDPRLPKDDIDLVHLCNSYHHLTERTRYFRNLAPHLRPDARVAILDTREGTPFFIIPHGIYPDQIRQEMEAAGYRYTASHDFLPFNSFEVYQWSSSTTASEQD